MSDVRMCGFERRMSVRDALATLDAHLEPLPPETMAVADAGSRVSSSDITARIDVPHFRRAMMDGYAVLADSTLGASEQRPLGLRLVGEVRAGAEPELKRPLAKGEALAVTTGAAVVDGADAVLMAELTRREEGELLATGEVSRGKHIGLVGEDIAKGATIVRAGRLLRPQDLGVLASAGVGELEVVRRPRVRLVVTGDELLAPGQLPSGPRVVDSNSLVLAELVARDGGILESLQRIEDDREAIRSAMIGGEADVVLVSGGSSVGPEDHAPLILGEIGELAVHGVAMRPSSPTGFGFITARAVFLLPGNPVSCLCAYEFFAGRAIRALGGRPKRWPHRRRQAFVAQKLVSALGRTDYCRVQLEGDGVKPLMTSGASILSSTTRADGVVIIDDEREGHAVGERVEVLLYDEPVFTGARP